jgi:ribonuclease HII
MIGVDEVGRGCWAGPLLVVAARQTGILPAGLTDSKLLSKCQREALFPVLRANFEFGEGWVSAAEIDQKGLASALRLGVSNALSALKVLFDEEIILDGKVQYVDSKFINSAAIIDADLNNPVVSAASIYAKVVRDKFMYELGLKHPKYGFENHVGYGTKAHALALKEFGILHNIHRTSYKPVGALLK